MPRPLTSLIQFFLAITVLTAAACGSGSDNTTNAAYLDDLDDRADQALEPTAEPAAAQPAEPTAVPAPPADTATEAEATAVPAAPTSVASAAEPTAVPTAVSTAGAATEPPAATAASAGDYDGVLPTWFSIPPGFTPTTADLEPGDVDVLTIGGSLSGEFRTVCADFERQAQAAGLTAFGGSCGGTQQVYRQGNLSATAQTFSRTTAEFVFIGFELVPGGSALSAPPTTTAPPATAATAPGIWPAWYQPPVTVIYLEHRDASNGERRVQTNITGDYAAVCDDFRAQAAAVGLLPTTSKQCDDEIIRWSIVEGPTGADAEIQDVDGLSYDVLFVFDAAALQLAGSGTASPATPDTVPPTAEATETSDDETAVLPPWFNPTVNGTDLSHAVENGNYQLVATGEIAASQTFTELCEEFERQATAAGWVRSDTDECGENTFDGATLRDPATGFESTVRNYRGNEITYAFEVGTNLTPAEITRIAFDPELEIMPSGFSLVAGDTVVALGEGIDNTGAYTSSIEVSGAADFATRCAQLEAVAGTANIIVGSCDPAAAFVTFRTGNTTTILEGAVYTFVTR